MSRKKFWLFPILFSGAVLLIIQILKQKRVALQNKVTNQPPQAIILAEQVSDKPQHIAVQESTNSQPSEANVAEDDLRTIEGIGPKISKLLISKGIFTFQQLRTTGVEGIKLILYEEGLRLANPETWPEQAAFAEKGDLEGLKRFQDQLKGGRKVK